MCMGPPRRYHEQATRFWVYPHVYGATWKVRSGGMVVKGLSPCVWGHRNEAANLLHDRGSIPMCMGPPKRAGNLHPDLRVYPHVYGATTPEEHGNDQKMGLSPCVWGHLSVIAFSKTLYGSIPMCMGPPICVRRLIRQSGVYPHENGASGHRAPRNESLRGLSPCVWGHLAQSAEDLGIKGSIPMCMGPPKQNRYAANPSRVYPHVYGAT